ALKHYGYAREQFLRMTLLDIRPPEDREAVRLVAGSQRATYEAGRTWRHLKAGGTQIAGRIFSRNLSYEGHDAVLVATIDVTERKRAEDELRSTRAFLDTVVENIPASILVKDAADLRYVLINRAAESMLGVARGDLIGKHVRDVFPKEQADAFTADD